MKAAEQAILSTLEEAVLQPEISELTIAKAIKKLRVGDPEHRQNVERALKAVTVELTRLTQAIVVNAGPVPTLVWQAACASSYWPRQ
jgi:hypothetical protein